MSSSLLCNARISLIDQNILTGISMLTYHSFQQINMIVNTTIFFHFLYVGPLGVSCYKHSGLTLCLWNYNAAVNNEQNFFSLSGCGPLKGSNCFPKRASSVGKIIKCHGLRYHHILRKTCAICNQYRDWGICKRKMGNWLKIKPADRLTGWSDRMTGWFASWPGSSGAKVDNAVHWINLSCG